MININWKYAICRFICVESKQCSDYAIVEWIQWIQRRFWKYSHKKHNSNGFSKMHHCCYDHPILIVHWLVLLCSIDMVHNNTEKYMQHSIMTNCCYYNDSTYRFHESQSILYQNNYWDFNVFQWLFHLDLIASIASIYESIRYYQWIILLIFLKIGEILLISIINGWIINISLILIDQSHPIIVFMINNTKVIK